VTELVNYQLVTNYLNVTSKHTGKGKKFFANQRTGLIEWVAANPQIQPPKPGVSEGVWRTDVSVVNMVFEEEFALSCGTTTYTAIIAHVQMNMVQDDSLSVDGAIQEMIKGANVFVVYSDGDTAVKKLSDVLDALDACTADVCALCNGKDAAKDDSAMELIACDLCNRSWHHKCLSVANQKAFEEVALLLCDDCNSSDFISSMRAFHA
jgi:hypothetical protein